MGRALRVQRQNANSAKVWCKGYKGHKGYEGHKRCKGWQVCKDYKDVKARCEEHEGCEG